MTRWLVRVAKCLAFTWIIPLVAGPLPRPYTVENYEVSIQADLVKQRLNGEVKIRFHSQVETAISALELDAGGLQIASVVEGHIEGVTGWCIGESRRTAAGNTPADNTAEAESLYNKLEGVILPMYYNDRAKFLEVMQHAIAINGSFFNTQRMVQQYITDAYLR